MEKEETHLTGRILNLTLEIIYLLIGEECIIVKKPTDDHMTRTRKLLSSVTEHPTPTLISEINNDKKILEVIQKIIGLLTGEVSVRCQDVTVYFSMEEWEYLEGHKDLYKDLMMEKQSSPTSPGRRKQV
ncbi:gastrula zinc finger protein XlCGF66.1-like [Pyxicephalus adspersus]|uniref:gastrula zinc finger protein XlCGF66.1-like n=1 Tax=Pyxicephalus adspersus TaxID=30357 RepID=UPI003B591BE7